MTDLAQTLHDLTSGEALPKRRALAKAITLMESSREDHRNQADQLLTQLLPHTGLCVLD